MTGQIPPAGSSDAVFIAENLINLPASEALYASASGVECFFIDTKGQRRTEFCAVSSTEENYETRVLKFVTDQLDKNPDQQLTLDNFSRLENPVLDDIYEARQILLTKILPPDRMNPPFKFKRYVIERMGDALDQQTGKNIGAYDIPRCLKQLFVSDNPWYREYLALQRNIGGRQRIK